MFYVVFNNACLKAPLPATFLIKTPDLESSLISLISEMHFAISVLHVLHVLVLSSAVQAEPEAECLLQSPRQLALKADMAVPARQIHQIPSDLRNLCSASGFTSCTCSAAAPSKAGLDLEGCRSHCLPYPAFTLIEYTTGATYCYCCASSHVQNEPLEAAPLRLFESTVQSSLAYKFVRDPLPYEGLCQEDQTCQCGNFATSGSRGRRVAISNLEGVPENCAHFCSQQGWPTFSASTSACSCCADSTTDTPADGLEKTYTVTASIDAETGSAYGDPHITTLDGHHYTLMQQGIFSFWHLSGLEAQFHSENGLVKTVPVDWQIFTRYAGHQAFTKGLLLVDKSGGSVRQVMEMTSQDCQWRARKAGGEWTVVKDEEDISVPDGEDYVTGFRIEKKGPKGYKHIHLNVNTKSGKRDKAVVSLSCRPHHNVNLQLVMKQRRGAASDYRFVEGELKVSRGVSTLQTDSEFAVHEKWEELGGSHWAAAYLNMDQTADDAFWRSCSREEESKAQEECSKHLGEIQHGSSDETFFKDCIYDVCHGAGETAAELAAELLASTRAMEGI
eukprot:s2030_g9.t1